MTVIAARQLMSIRIAALVEGHSVAVEPQQIERSEPLDSRSAAQTFEAIYDDHYRDVYRYVLLSLRRRDETDDVVADTFGRAFAAWRLGHGPAGRALPWLFLIARRIMLDRWRRERLLRLLPLGRHGRSDSDVADTDDPDGRAEFWIWLKQLAAALPDRQREVLFLRYQRDLTDEDIGEILGLSASGVRPSLPGRSPRFAVTRSSGHDGKRARGMVWPRAAAGRR